MSQARPANELDPLPELAKYELLEEVGHGGMATVYRARDRRLGREVAVKIIHRHLRDNPEVATRFTSEARAVAKLRHPNIVEVYDVSDDEDRERYLVVELVRGTTLRKLLLERGHLPAEIAATIALAVADALHHAHQQGVIHRDVKPENVLVAEPSADDSERASNPESLVKITDFGIAKILDAQGVTSTGQVLGSPAHMSPEQIEGGEVSARSDVFGLGVLLYECMVGELPFDGRNPAQVLRRVLDGTYLAADRARDTVGFRFSRILDRALAHAPLDRYESAAELGNELSAELGRLGFAEPYRELDEYLRNPTSYLETYSARMVERLAELGREAQTAGDVVEAAHQFNRALAFRPDDPELIRLVSGLTRAKSCAPQPVAWGWALQLPRWWDWARTRLRRSTTPGCIPTSRPPKAASRRPHRSPKCRRRQHRCRAVRLRRPLPCPGPWPTPHRRPRNPRRNCEPSWS